MTQVSLKSKILGVVPLEHEFRFATQEGVYTGIIATSLADFAQKLATADVNSIRFHYPRGDFQKWIEDTLGDKELANKMCFIKTNLSGEDLRKQLIKLVQKRINDLKGI